MKKYILYILIFNLFQFTCQFTEPKPLYPQNNNTSNEEVKEWNIKDEFPHISMRRPDKEKPGVIRILQYNWTINDGEHKGVYEKEVATIFDTAKRNKPFKVKPNGYLLIEGDVKPKKVSVEIWEGEFKEIPCKNDRVIMPDKVGKYPMKVTLYFDNGTITYGILVQCQR